ncbi:hypothetical protein KY290_011056 [Solanum tuberosum]|uniref:Uncharacterized protein n=1 Tax=Solanum tuberosum TaxID=4113 RepID=A0ABQ7VZI6_SOLTU|nr:hypothetical protein KY290_011056 [Solanum tuberosum]
MISSLPLQPPPLPPPSLFSIDAGETERHHRPLRRNLRSPSPLLSSLPSLPFPLLLSARTTPPVSSVTATAAAGGEQAVTRPPPISKLQQTSGLFCSLVFFLT